jgi:lipopolysaccharide/colanic/teichoic acid biosynthesis glycosyltransferase
VVTYEVELYPDWYHRRFLAKPGLTGLWQVSGRSRLTYEQMVKLDIEFVSRRSLVLYLAILARTLPALVFRMETA